ncbi:hypothetical protein LCGC14_0466520 [marine sediment metagenome]|uniref:Uncharacterized protein n=1 Tax=marine sediment metagenome TaxID=412755 RepID=A0A0F9SWI1_9ZZZZ
MSDILNDLTNSILAIAKRIRKLEILVTGGTISGHIIQDESVSLAQRINLNFTGAGVTATDDAGNNQTDITIPGGGAGATDVLEVQVFS